MYKYNFFEAHTAALNVFLAIYSPRLGSPSEIQFGLNGYWDFLSRSKCALRCLYKSPFLSQTLTHFTPWMSRYQDPKVCNAFDLVELVVEKFIPLTHLWVHIAFFCEGFLWAREPGYVWQGAVHLLHGPVPLHPLKDGHKPPGAWRRWYTGRGV